MFNSKLSFRPKRIELPCSKTVSNWFGLKLHGGAIHVSYHKPSLWSASL